MRLRVVLPVPTTSCTLIHLGFHLWGSMHLIPLEHAKAWTPNAAPKSPNGVWCPAFRLPLQAGQGESSALFICSACRRLPLLPSRGHWPTTPARLLGACFHPRLP